MSDAPLPAWVGTAARAVETIAASLWLGGLVALGAFAAPAVFGIVPAPWSADAMTVVFRRFDRLALTAAAVVLACEMVRARTGSTPPDRVDRARTGTALAAAALAAVVGGWASPRIADLHAAGAIRGVDAYGVANQLAAQGAELDRVHHLAEWASQGEVVFLVGFLLLMNIPARAASVGPSVEAR